MLGIVDLVEQRFGLGRHIHAGDEQVIGGDRHGAALPCSIAPCPLQAEKLRGPTGPFAADDIGFSAAMAFIEIESIMA